MKGELTKETEGDCYYFSVDGEEIGSLNREMIKDELGIEIKEDVKTVKLEIIAKIID